MGLFVALIVGAIAGWLAGLLVKGHGQGLFLNMLTGVLGAVIASWLFPAAGFVIGGPDSFIGAVISATLGAVILLVLVQLVRKS